MSAEIYFVVVTVDNRLMAGPPAHLIHGILDEDEWPIIRRGQTSSEIRINALNRMNHQSG